MAPLEAPEIPPAHYSSTRRQRPGQVSATSHVAARRLARRKRRYLCPAESERAGAGIPTCGSQPRGACAVVSNRASPCAPLPTRVRSLPSGRVTILTGLSIGVLGEHGALARAPPGPLAARRRFLPCSDGVTEQFDAKGEMFGAHRSDACFLRGHQRPLVGARTDAGGQRRGVPRFRAGQGRPRDVRGRARQRHVSRADVAR